MGDDGSQCMASSNVSMTGMVTGQQGSRAAEIVGDAHGTISSSLVGGSISNNCDRFAELKQSVDAAVVAVAAIAAATSSAGSSFSALPDDGEPFFPFA